MLRAVVAQQKPSWPRAATIRSCGSSVCSMTANVYCKQMVETYQGDELKVSCSFA